MTPLLAQRPGVDRAFERLYRRHALDVYRYANAVLRNQADAEDVTQTTFMNAYRALERGARPESPHNWLIAIAHNVCRQRFRAASRRVQEVMIEDDVADHLVEPEEDDAPTAQDIKRALGQLAFNQRTALVMRELEGRSYAEIADLLGISIGAVETLIFRARRALREQLDAALTCGQAEQLLSRQLDGALAKDERAQLRAHLRACATCRRVARSQRAHRSALRSLGVFPLPNSLASLFGGTAPVAAKLAVAAVTATVAGGVSYGVHEQLTAPPKHQAPSRQARHAAGTSERHRPAALRRRPIAVAVVKSPVTKAPVAAAHHVHVRHHAKPTWARQPQHPSHPQHPASPAGGTAHRPATPAPPAKSRGRAALAAGQAHAAGMAKPHDRPLTHSSQTKGARNAGGRHLHP